MKKIIAIGLFCTAVFFLIWGFQKVHSLNNVLAYVCYAVGALTLLIGFFSVRRYLHERKCDRDEEDEDEEDEDEKDADKKKEESDSKAKSKIVVVRGGFFHRVGLVAGVFILIAILSAVVTYWRYGQVMASWKANPQFIGRTIKCTQHYGPVASVFYGTIVKNDAEGFEATVTYQHQLLDRTGELTWSADRPFPSGAYHQALPERTDAIVRVHPEQAHAGKWTLDVVNAKGEEWQTTVEVVY